MFFLLLPVALALAVVYAGLTVWRAARQRHAPRSTPRDAPGGRRRRFGR